MPLFVVWPEGIASYVVLNTIHYACVSVIDAIDLTFKVIFALDVRYLKESEQIYLFLQQYLYDIQENSQDSVASVKELLSVLR